MRKITLVFPLTPHSIEIRETILPLPDGHPTGEIMHVKNIYQWAYKTFNFTTATQICLAIGQNHLNDLIDRMPAEIELNRYFEQQEDAFFRELTKNLPDATGN